MICNKKADYVTYVVGLFVTLSIFAELIVEFLSLPQRTPLPLFLSTTPPLDLVFSPFALITSLPKRSLKSNGAKSYSKSYQ